MSTWPEQTAVTSRKNSVTQQGDPSLFTARGDCSYTLMRVFKCVAPIFIYSSVYHWPPLMQAFLPQNFPNASWSFSWHLAPWMKKSQTSFKFWLSHEDYLFFSYCDCEWQSWQVKASVTFKPNTETVVSCFEKIGAVSCLLPFSRFHWPAKLISI